jgi:arylsulfatase A-like enzyme
VVSLFLALGVSAAPRPNILFLFADDWGRYASAYAAVDQEAALNAVVRTPNVDRIAREGVLFRNAFVSAPSCTPCRSALFSGRPFFTCGRGAILRPAHWEESLPAFPLILRDAGYHIGKSYKVWGPGEPADAPFGGQRHAYEKAGRAPNNFSEETAKRVAQGMTVEAARAEILAQVCANFDAFLADRKPGQPWFYYFGTTTTHREWVKGSGRQHWGIDPDALKGRMPAAFPDVPEVREDVADYLGECQAVDACLGELVRRLEETGELDNTVIVASGDHGIPGLPDGKCNLYPTGTSVALAVRLPGGKGGRVVDDFVSLPDLAPTFLECAGLAPPAAMTARSLLPVLRSDRSGQVDPERTWAVTGRERHVDLAREGRLPYPMRALHTPEFVYIRNYAPERWPMGAPYAAAVRLPPPDSLMEHGTFAAFPDFDASPTKAWLVRHRDAPPWAWHYARAFGKRPAEELYDLRADRDLTNNLAAAPAYAGQRQRLAARLDRTLKEWNDPRVSAAPVPFEQPPLTDAEVRKGPRPNLVFILADDLAMGDLGCYGQRLIQTPNLDRLAREGTRYTQAYSGTSVCAPSRASLMTGLHTGHCPVRANRELRAEGGQLPLPPETVTVAQLLRGAGYATACVGKWGMGFPGSTGDPLKKGFEHFFGFNCQRHAHDYYTDYLYRDDARIAVDANADGAKKIYAPDLVADDANGWIHANRNKPFFLFYASTLPHGGYSLTELGEYADKPWTQQEKTYAAMVTRLDRDVGRLMATLDELGLTEKTLVLFAGDNGTAFAPDAPVFKRFYGGTASAALRGFKRGLYEGGLRNAALARWPGTVPAGAVRDEPWAFWDFLPTAVALAKAPVPAACKSDGRSLVDFLKGGPAPQRDCFYWELHEGAPLQAVRFGDWKAVRPGPGKPLELYDLSTDPAEENDVAAAHPGIVGRAETLMAAQHAAHVLWPLDRANAPVTDEFKR